MPTNITDVDTYTDPLVAPSAGDGVTGAGVQTIAQGAGNRGEFLRSRSWGCKTGQVYAVPLAAHESSTSRFSMSFAGGSPQWNQASVADAGNLWIPIPPRVQAKCRITRVDAYVDGNSHAGLPATMPKITLYRQNYVTAAGATSVGTATDTSATFGAYDTPHAISITGLTHDIVSDNVYWLRFEGEAGANSVAFGLSLFGITLTIAPV